MALWKPFRGNRAGLDSVAKHDGYVYFCIDDATLFFDYTDAEGNLQRKQINAKDAETALQEITTTENSGLKITNKKQIDIDDNVTFIFDCGTSTENISLFTIETNEAGGQTAIIG